MDIGDVARGSGDGLTAGSAFSLSLFGVGIGGVAAAGDDSVDRELGLSVSILLNIVANRDCVAERASGPACTALLVGVAGAAGAGDLGVGWTTRFSCTTISSIAVGARTFLSVDSFS